MAELYSKWIKEQLEITNTRVRKWVDWNPDSTVYEAFFESRSVIIPRPTDSWSFLIGLHEIGHISTGERLFSYLAEYNAEKWAIQRAKKIYNIENIDYIEDAKNYVRTHLLDNLAFSSLTINKVKPYVLEWLNETSETIKEKVECYSHTLS
jgi:hypothetical protein